MRKVELKTQENDASVDAFLASVADPERRRDCETVLALMQRVTGEPPRMWGSSIIGFGRYEYRSPATGRGGDWMRTGFSPRKQNLTFYLMSGFRPLEDLMAKLGKHSTGGSCLYVKRLADIDLKVLEQAVRRSLKTPMGEASAAAEKPVAAKATAKRTAAKKAPAQPKPKPKPARAAAGRATARRER